MRWAGRNVCYMFCWGSLLPQGKLTVKNESGAMIPPWLIRYFQNLEDDGIQSEEDLRFVTDDVFELWEQVGRIYVPW